MDRDFPGRGDGGPLLQNRLRPWLLCRLMLAIATTLRRDLSERFLVDRSIMLKRRLHAVDVKMF
ncbi:MAG: hypothetical protein D6820_04215 [Lentisphaerae bacterium]|nr:MAG: hypothetical protein D6820_04215 [Lentisphaerota bacterium]